MSLFYRKRIIALFIAFTLIFANCAKKGSNKEEKNFITIAILWFLSQTGDGGTTTDPPNPPATTVSKTVTVQNQNGGALANVTVTVTKDGQVTVFQTDANGRVNLTGLENGEYQVVISDANNVYGRFTITVTNNQVSSMQVASGNIKISDTDTGTVYIPQISVTHQLSYLSQNDIVSDPPVGASACGATATTTWLNEIFPNLNLSPLTVYPQTQVWGVQNIPFHLFRPISAATGEQAASNSYITQNNLSQYYTSEGNSNLPVENAPIFVAMLGVSGFGNPGYDIAGFTNACVNGPTLFSVNQVIRITTGYNSTGHFLNCIGYDNKGTETRLDDIYVIQDPNTLSGYNGEEREVATCDMFMNKDFCSAYNSSAGIRFNFLRYFPLTTVLTEQQRNGAQLVTLGHNGHGGDATLHRFTVDGSTGNGVDSNGIQHWFANITNGYFWLYHTDTRTRFARFTPGNLPANPTGYDVVAISRADPNSATSLVTYNITKSTGELLASAKASSDSDSHKLLKTPIGSACLNTGDYVRVEVPANTYISAVLFLPNGNQCNPVVPTTFKMESLNIASGASNVPISTVFEADFASNIDTSEANLSNIQLLQNNSPIPLGFNLPAQNKLKFYAKNGLNYSANYTLKFLTGLKDLDGKTLDKEYSYTFTTEAEPVSCFAIQDFAYPSSSYSYKVDEQASISPKEASGSPITSYSVSPAVSNGLSFNTQTGKFSGTITGVFDKSYTVTATNCKGSATATVSIKAENAVVAPYNLTYPQTNMVFKIGDSVSNTPSVAGTPPTLYQINKTVPSGIGFNTSTGKFYGSPSTYSPLTTYRVTASNSAGSTYKDVTIKVNVCNIGETISRSCSIQNGTGIQYASCKSDCSGYGNYEICQLISCNSGYTPSGNSCVADVPLEIISGAITYGSMTTYPYTANTIKIVASIVYNEYLRIEISKTNGNNFDWSGKYYIEFTNGEFIASGSYLSNYSLIRQDLPKSWLYSGNNKIRVRLKADQPNNAETQSDLPIEVYRKF